MSSPRAIKTMGSIDEASGDALWRIQDKIQLEIQEARLTRERHDKTRRALRQRMERAARAEVRAAAAYGQRRGLLILDKKGLWQDGSLDLTEDIRALLRGC